MILSKYLALFVFLSTTMFGQRLSHPVMVSRDDAFSRPRVFQANVDTISVLAVMVQFQQDNSSLTSGDGQFDLSQQGDPILDPAPHDRQYFLDHLTFVKNYFQKSSKGKVFLRVTVLTPVVTLSGQMQSYSPPRVGSTVAVGNLARDAWQEVDSMGLVPDFSIYDCFIVLHAGTGRDIDLVSLLGYDPTPYDIPSLYIGLNGFKEYYGSDYEGIPVNSGSFQITNSIVIPESESRLLPTVSGNTLLELTINGLLCASVGNFLGLPDLFDTNTGHSGIGRFGLMDGQAIFSFSGLFPPEPSAWERYWLGWIEPITVQSDSQAISLPAISLADTVYRIPISAQEYFLVENRNRDPQRNGQRISYTFHGVNQPALTFPRDTIGFNAFDVSSLSGVVTDVDDLDWSLPGGVDENGTFYDGGALIWHIDESQIAHGLQTNGVNANPDHRGVDLEEADGSQDIGQQYEFLSPGSGSEEGTALDFWYSGNGSPVNKNIFSPTSHPDSRSYSSANSHITIKNFSARGPHMTAMVAVGDDAVKLLPGFPKRIGEKLPANALTIGNLSGPGSSDMLVTTTGQPADFSPQIGPVVLPIAEQAKLYAWKPDGAGVLATSPASGVFALGSSTSPSGYSHFGTPASVVDLNGDGVSETIVGEVSSLGTSLRAFTSRDVSNDSLADNAFTVPIGFQSLTTTPVVSDSIIAVGASNGRVYFFGFAGSLVDSLQGSAGDTIIGITLSSSSNAFLVASGNGVLTITSRNPAGGTSTPDVTRNMGEAIRVSPAGALFGNDLRFAFVTTRDNLFLVDGNLNVIPGFPVHITGAGSSGSPALADLDGDGSRDIVVFAGNRIHAFNRSGASLDNFPISLTTTSSITSAPIVADVNGDGNPEVVAVAGDGFVAAFDKNGRMAPGFPLQAGTGLQSAAVFVQSLGLNVSGIDLAVASSSTGSVVAWRTGNVQIGVALLPWSQYQRDARHTAFATESLQGTALSSEFFPATRAYNWPNPVYDGKTLIRYFVKDNATVNIKVFDLAGDLVATIPNPPGVGGLDNEVEWNATDVQSGIYFARIEASGASGSGVAVIKIAVVK